MARTGLTCLFHFFHADCAAGFVQAPDDLDLLAFVLLRSRLIVELVCDIICSSEHILSARFHDGSRKRLRGILFLHIVVLSRGRTLTWLLGSGTWFGLLRRLRRKHGLGLLSLRPCNQLGAWLADVRLCVL